MRATSLSLVMVVVVVVVGMLKRKKGKKEEAREGGEQSVVSQTAKAQGKLFLLPVTLHSHCSRCSLATFHFAAATPGATKTAVTAVTAGNEPY